MCFSRTSFNMFCVQGLHNFHMLGRRLLCRGLRFRKPLPRFQTLLVTCPMSRFSAIPTNCLAFLCGDLVASGLSFSTRLSKATVTLYLVDLCLCLPHRQKAFSSLFNTSFYFLQKLRIQRTIFLKLLDVHCKRFCFGLKHLS